jgi:hypothetical protein
MSRRTGDDGEGSVRGRLELREREMRVGKSAVKLG